MKPDIPNFSLFLCKLALTFANNAYNGAQAFTGGKMLYAQEKNEVFLPKFYAYDYDGTLFVCCRGSASTKDWYTDFNYSEITQNFGEYKLNVHHGFYKAALNVFTPLKQIIADYPGNIVFTGHSYGASTATVLLLIASTDPLTKSKKDKMGTFAFAPAPCVENLPDYFFNRIASFVYGYDIVTSLSIPNSYNGFKDVIPKGEMAKIALKILIKTAVTVLKNKHLIANSLYNGIMGACDPIVDDIVAYSNDQTYCKVGQVAGVSYLLDMTIGRLSDCIVDQYTQLNYLRLSEDSARDHNVHNYINALESKVDDE